MEIPGQLNSQGTNTSLERTGVFSAGKNDSEVDLDKLNPRKYMQIHTSTVVHGVGGALMEPFPKVFDMLQYFQMILHSVEIL